MRSPTKSMPCWVFFAIVIAFFGWFSVFPIPALAQGTQGQNAVCSSSSGCSAQAGSSAFIDASQFFGNISNPNFCSVLNFILNPTNKVIPATGAVIDARVSRAIQARA
jgi:hypothetical protein